MSADMRKEKQGFFFFLVSVVSLLIGFGGDEVNEVGVGQVECMRQPRILTYMKKIKVTKGRKLMDSI